MGLRPEAYYHATQELSGRETSPCLWLDFHHASTQVRNLAVMARRLWELANVDASPENVSCYRMALGHFLHFTAHDNIESLRAYQSSAIGKWAYQLSAILALHRLRRSTPLLNEVTAVLETLRRKFPVQVRSHEALDTLLSEQSDSKLRSSLFTEQSLGCLLELGDASQALDWLRSAVIDQDSDERIPEVVAAIARAVPDNPAMFSSAIDLMIREKAWTLLDETVSMIELLPFGFPEASIPSLISAFAQHLDNPFKAAHYLYAYALQSPDACRDLILNRSWICRYAIEYPFFCEALLESLKVFHDDKLTVEVYLHLERFGKTQALKFQAQIERIHRLIAENHEDKALKSVLTIVRNATPNQAFDLFDILSDFVHFGDGDAPQTWNSGLIRVGDILFQKTGDKTLYSQFLTRCLTAVPEDADPTSSLSAYHLEIRKKLRHPPTETDIVPQSPYELSETSLELQKKCRELAANGDLEGACFEFLKGYPNGVTIAQGLVILLQIDADVMHRFMPSWEQLERMQEDPNISDNASVIACRLVLEPEWYRTLNPTSQDFPWGDVIDILLRFVTASPISTAVCDLILEILKDHPIRDSALSLFTLHLKTVLQYAILFKQVLQMSEKTSQQQELLDEIEAELASCTDNIRQRNTLYERKFALAQKMGDERMQMTSLRDILETTPDDDFACRELRALDPSTLKPHTQILYYQLRLFTDEDKQDRLSLQTELAHLYTQTSQFNNAITLYHSIIEEFPECLEARYRLVDLLESLENWKSAENILLELVNAETSPVNRYQSLIRLANIQNEHMMMPSRALLTLFAALDIDLGKLNALHAKMCEISEHMHSFSPLLDKYEDISMHAKDYVVRKTATLLLANVYADHLRKPAIACNILDEFYNHGGSDDPAFIQVLAKFYGEIKHWNGYIQMLIRLLNFTEDKEDRVILALTIAHTYADNLGDHIQAAQYARLASESKPKLAEQWIDIANFLLACETPDSAVQSLYNAAALTTDSAQKAIILLETARLLAEMDKLADAASVFHKATELRPPLEQITPVGEALISATTIHQNREIFNEVCFDLVQCCPDSERTPLILQQSLTLARVFKANDEARRLIRENMSRLSALDLDQSLILAQILTTLNESTLASQVLNGIFKNFELTRDQRLECLHEQLENAEHLEDMDMFREVSQAILELDANDYSTLFSMLELDYHAGKWKEASTRIEQLMPVLDKLDDDEIMLTHYYASEIFHASERDDEALAHLDQVLSSHEDFRPAVDLKLTILLNHERWLEALPLFHTLLELSEDPDVQGAIHKRIAELYHFYLDDPEGAVYEYEQALTLGGDIEDVPMRLLQLYQELAMWQKAAMTAQILASAQVDSPDARFTYLAILGDIQATHLGELTQAIATLQEAFALNPLDRDLISELALLLVRNQSWEDLRSIFEHLYALLPSPEAIEVIKTLAQTVSSCSHCADMVKKAVAELDQCGVKLELKPSTPQLPAKPEVKTRKRAQTSPRGSLTYDSSLLRNPELSPQPSSPNLVTSDDALFTASTKEIPMSLLLDDDDFTCPRLVAHEDEPKSVSQPVIALPDEALMPIETETTRNKLPLTTPTTQETVTRQKTSTFLPTLTQYSSDHYAALRALDDLSFTTEDILLLEKDALPFAKICISDLLKLCASEHEVIARKPLPSTLANPEIRSELFTISSPALSDSECLVIKALASDKDSPALTDVKKFPKLDVSALEPDLKANFEKLRAIFDAPSVLLTPRSDAHDVSSVVLPTLPPMVCCTSEFVNRYAESEWIARMAFGIYMARPENLLMGALQPNDVLQHMHKAILAMLPATASSELDARTRLIYRKVMSKVGLKSQNMPVYTDDLLTKIKQHAIESRRQGFRVAFLLSQSLIACMRLISEVESVRFPTTLLTLKSAIKRSSYIRDLVHFGLSHDAETLYAAIHP